MDVVGNGPARPSRPPLVIVGRLRAWRPTGRQSVAVLVATVVLAALGWFAAGWQRTQREDRVVISVQAGAEVNVDTATRTVSLIVGLQNVGAYPATLTAGSLSGKGLVTVGVRSSGASNWSSQVGLADGETFTRTRLGPADFGGIRFIIRAPCGSVPAIPSLVIRAESKAGGAHRLRFGLTAVLLSDQAHSVEQFWSQAFHDACSTPGS